MFKLKAKTAFSLYLLFFAVLFTGSRAIYAQPTIQLQPYLTGLSSPVFVTNAKDGSNRAFIVQQGGIIKVVQPGSTAPTDFLNITSRVLSGGERGLLGLAFHPNYAQNRRFFVYYTRQTDGAIQIAEYKTSASNPNVADTTEKIIITIPHPTNSNHNGGTVEFGPDGYLYAGTGDGGSGNDPPNNAQNINVLLGKIIRINIDVPETQTPPYSIPADNPYAGATPGADEIYAIGMRNPYRFSFDRGGSRQLYAGDVGQGVIEEIDIITRGGNYGWRAYEGTQCTGLNPQECAGGTNPINHTPPIFEYTHAGGRCSITGGYVYRGRRGTFQNGTYVFADYCTGEIMIQSATPRAPTVLLDTPSSITCFGEDEAGEIYVCTGGGVQKLVNPNAATPRATVADFDGDLRTDVSVVRTGDRHFWYILGSTSGFRAEQFGGNVGGDQIVPGDYDGDGKTDLAVWRPSGLNAYWFSIDSSTGAFRAFQFGCPICSDAPVPADYDGDGKVDYAVWRDNVRRSWIIYNSSTGTTRMELYGDSGDYRLPADYDGDGRADIAVYRPSEGRWHMRRSRDGETTINWGAPGDLPVPGDYDGDGKVDVAVFRRGISDDPAYWYVLQSSNNQLYARQWGSSGDFPVPGDYDGDGKTDMAVIRIESGNKIWYIHRSFSNTFKVENFGLQSDLIVANYDFP